MKTVAKFYKVPYDQFKEDILKYYPKETEEDIKKMYDNIITPKRSTERSSGYDFYSPIQTICEYNKTVVIPTGVGIEFKEPGYDLTIIPRSGMGSKYKFKIDNTVGLIDNDYFEADNHGHIIMKMTVTDINKYPLLIGMGTKFCQGIIREFFLAEEEAVTNKRTGGYGSTN